MKVNPMQLFVNNQKVVTQNFRGINFVHQLYNYMPDRFGRVYTEDMVAQELDAMKKMRVKIIRSYYGSSYAWNPETGTHDFESPEMQAFYKNCKDMEKLGIEVGITPLWCIRSLAGGPIKSFFDRRRPNLSFLGGAKDGEIEHNAKILEKFVEDSVRAFDAHDINNIKYFFCFTECNNTFSKKSPRNNTICVRRKYERLIPIYERFIRAVDQGLKNAGARDRIKIVAPCDNWRADDGSEPYSILVKYTVEHLADVVDIIGSHNGYDRNNDYGDDDYYTRPPTKLSDPRDQAQKIGKEFWVDEYNVAINKYTAEFKKISNRDPNKGLALGAMANSIMNMGDIHNVLLWTLFDQQWPNSTAGGEFDNGVHVCGYYPCLLRERTPLPAWYSAALLSRYIGAGDIYECTIGDSVYLSAIQRTDGEWTLLVTNYNEQDVPVEIGFAEGMGGKNFYHYEYCPNTINPTEGNEMIGSDRTISGVDALLCDTLTARTVNIYTTELDA